MRKFTLFLSLFIAMTMTAVAQSTLDLTFTKVSSTDATVAVVAAGDDAVEVGEITATVAANYNWKELSANNATFPNTSILCPDKNTKDMTAGNEGVFTITLNNVPENYEFGDVTFTSCALNGSGEFQGDADNAQEVNFTLKNGETTLGTVENKVIKVNSNGGEAVTVNFDVADSYKATDGTLTLTLTLSTTEARGCFYGLTKISIETNEAAEVAPIEPEYFGVEKITPAEGVVTELRSIHVVPTVSSLLEMPTGWTITDANNNNYEVTIDWGMNQWYDVMVILNEPITAAGTYTLTIPEGSAQDDYGKIIAAAKYSWTIEAPVYTASVTTNPATLPMTDVAAWSTVENNVATFTAEVYNDKYEFVGWTNGTETVSTELVYTVTLTENLELVANFQEKATEPVEPAYDWVGEYTVDATITPSVDLPATMTVVYSETEGRTYVESIFGYNLRVNMGYNIQPYPTLQIAEDGKSATVNMQTTGLYIAFENIDGGGMKWSLLKAKDGSSTITLTVDENGVVSIPDLQVQNVEMDADYNQTSTSFDITGVTATKPGGAVEPGEPEGLKPVVSLDADGLGTMPYKLSDEDAAKVFELSTLTVAVKVTTPATMSGRQALLCTSDPTANANTGAMPTGSAYVAYGFNNADLGYLASCKDGDRYTANAGITGSTEYVVVYVLNPAGNNYKSYVNGTKQVDRDFGTYEIATPKMVKEDHDNACIYIGGGVTAEGARETFAGTILGVQVYDGELTAEQIADLFPEPETPVYTASVTMNPATLPMTDVAAWSTVENNVATFTAEVYNDKYEFVGWTNGTETVSTELVYTVTLTENLELVANFQEKATEPVTPAVKWYRIKEVSTSEYMNVFSYDATAEQSAYGLVNVAAYNEEGADQIFTLEAAETEGQYYLRTQNDYYVTTAAWNVNVSNSGKSAIIFEETTVDDLTTYVLRDPSKAASGNYFKIGAVDGGVASGNFVYCDAPESVKATWVLEEVKSEEPEQPVTPAEAVVLDFTTNVWGIPGQYGANFSTQYNAEASYTDGTYTVTLAPGTANKANYFYPESNESINNALCLKYTGSKIVLPAFDFAVAKIEVVGHESATGYANADMNVFVGGNAVSTACNGSTGTNVFAVAADAQAAGTVYELIVGEAGGAYSSIRYITKINIYPASEGGDVEPIELAAPVLGDEKTKKYFDLYARIPVTATFPENATETAIYYTTNGDEPTTDSKTVESGSTVAISSYVGTTIKAVAYCVVDGKEYFSEVATATYYEAVTALYEMAGAVEAGKQYLFVANMGTAYSAMTPAEGTPIKTIAGAEVSVNDMFAEAFNFFAFTLEAEATSTSYKIKDATGMYLGIDGMSASFVVSETGQSIATEMVSYDWTVSFDDSGFATIQNSGRTLALVGTSWKTVTSVTMTDVLPQLFVAREYPTLVVTPDNKENQEQLTEFVISCETGLDIDEEAGEIVVRDQGAYEQVVVNPGTDDEYTDYQMVYNYFEFTAKMNDEGTAYTITLNEPITESGSYELVVPEGFFIIEPAGYAQPSEAINNRYTIVSNEPLVVDAVTPTDGSTVTSLKYLVVDFSENVGDIHIWNFDVKDEDGNVVTTATPSYQDENGGWFDDYSLVSLFLKDRGEITEAGTYTITIPAGAIGAETDPTKLNSEIVLTFTVAPATGINGVDAENGEAVIYDITGRKIEQITAPGIYIVNGKKVLVK